MIPYSIYLIINDMNFIINLKNIYFTVFNVECLHVEQKPILNGTLIADFFFQKQAYIPFILNQKIIRLFLKAAYHLIPITLKVFGNVLQNIKIAKSMKCFIFSTSKKTDVWAWNCLHWWKYPWDYGLFSSLCIPWIFRWLVWQPQCMPLQTLRWVEKQIFRYMLLGYFK